MNHTGLYFKEPEVAPESLFGYPKSVIQSSVYQYLPGGTAVNFLLFRQSCASCILGKAHAAHSELQCTLTPSRST